MRNRLSMRLERRGANDERSHLRRFRWVIFSLLLVATIFVVVFVLFAVSQMFEPQTLELGRQEIQAMKSEPIVGFRAPGTSLLRQQERPAATQPFGGGQSTTAMGQGFDMTGDPGDTVEAYRLAAQANGWEFVVDGCSRVERATAAVFAKRVGGFDATLIVHAQLDRDRATYAEPVRRGLVVTLEATKAAAGFHLSVDAGLSHNDVHCLRGVDPSGADLQPPAPPTLTMEELCSRIPVPEVKAITAQVEGVVLEEPAQCWLVNASSHPLFMVKHAGYPRAYYEDRRLPSAQGSTERFLFSAYGKKDPNLEHSVWVTTPSGTYVVRAGGFLDTEGTERLLLAVARLLEAIDPRPTPTGPPTTVVPESKPAVLIEYALDGGIAGTMRLVVAADGMAVYTGAGAQPVRFPVPPGRMEELRVALTRVDFGKLSPSYGAASGADRQTEVITYQGKTVRVASGGPPELRRLATVLNRLLDEGSRQR